MTETMAESAIRSTELPWDGLIHSSSESSTDSKSNIEHKDARRLDLTLKRISSNHAVAKHESLLQWLLSFLLSLPTNGYGNHIY